MHCWHSALVVSYKSPGRHEHLQTGTYHLGERVLLRASRPSMFVAYSGCSTIVALPVCLVLTPVKSSNSHCVCTT